MNPAEIGKKIIKDLLGRFNLRLMRVAAPGEAMNPAARSIARGLSAREHNTKENMDAFYADPNLMTHYFTQERLAFYERVHQELADLHLKPEEILDVGCGSGHLLARLAELYPDAKACGVDFSNEAINMARRLHPGSTFDVLSIFELEKLGMQFDLVACTEVIEHLEDADMAVEKLLAVCRPGGAVVITVPHGRQDTFAGHFNFWTPESFKREFRKHCPSVKEFGFYLFITMRKP